MTEVLFLSQEGPVYCPTVSAVGYIRRERVTGYTLVDGERNREMVYSRWSFSPSVSGEFVVMYEQPFGVGCVSGA